jgi:hypothetical protein
VAEEFNDNERKVDAFEEATRESAMIKFKYPYSNSEYENLPYLIINFSNIR